MFFYVQKPVSFLIFDIKSEGSIYMRKKEVMEDSSTLKMKGKYKFRKT